MNLSHGRNTGTILLQPSQMKGVQFSSKILGFSAGERKRGMPIKSFRLPIHCHGVVKFMSVEGCGKKCGDD